MNTQFPVRKHLPHEIPAWVSDNAKHFITLNCSQRGVDFLCRRQTADALLASISPYENLGHWWVWLLLIMPDHIHLIATFNRQRGIQRTITAWKSFHAKQLKIDWQSDYFEHRLRSDDHYREKASYIRMNPVRKGLIAEADKWPYLWQRH